MRALVSKIAASTTVLGQGEVLVDEAGRMYGGDGATQLKNLTPAVTTGVLPINVRAFPFNARGNGSANDTAAVDAALSFAESQSIKPAVWFPSGTYRRTSPIKPFSGMSLISDSRGAEFTHGVVIRNDTTDMFTPVGDVSDVTIRGINFQGGAARSTDWWTPDTGFQILYSSIEWNGFQFFRSIYSGNWTGVTFRDFYVNGSANDRPVFLVAGSDNIFGPGFVAGGSFKRTTLTADASAGATSFTVADGTGLVNGAIVFIGAGSATNLDMLTISTVSGNTVTLTSPLTKSHVSGEPVLNTLNTGMVESKLSHSLIDRLYLSPGPSMALHVTGGRASVYMNCELSGHVPQPNNTPTGNPGPGLYINGARGHVFIGTNASENNTRSWAQFTGGIDIYDSDDITFIGTIIADQTNTAGSYFNIARSGNGGGTILTNNIRISGTTRFNNSAAVPPISINSIMQSAINSGAAVVEYEGTNRITGRLTSGEETFDRLLANSAAISMTSGLMRFTFFEARKTEVVSQVRIASGTTAAAATPSLVRVGIYSVNAAGDLTLVASTPNDTTLLAAANTLYSKALSATLNKQVGSVYAIGVLVISAATMPSLAGSAPGIPASELAAAPRRSAALTGQTDLPTTITAASLTNGASMPYAAVTG